MKKLLFILFLLISSTAMAAVPTRQSTYVSGEVISSTAVTANEDAIFNYLTAGVEAYADGTISNSDISGSANVQSDKLNLTSVAQNVLVTAAGSLEVDGALNIDGAADFDGAVTFAGTTIADLGTVTTGVVTAVSINGGSILNTSIGNSPIGVTSPASGRFTTLNTSGALTASSTFNLGTTNQGDILYDNGTSLVRLTPGTSGQFLKTQGAAANPVWANNQQYFTLISVNTGAAVTTTTGRFALEVNKNYYIEALVEADTGNGAEPNIQGVELYNAGTALATGYYYTVEREKFHTTEVSTITSSNSGTNFPLGGTIKNEDNSGFISIKMWIDTHKNTRGGLGLVRHADIKMTSEWVNTSTDYYSEDLKGMLMENGDTYVINGFGILLDASAVKYTIRVYELRQSI